MAIRLARQEDLGAILSIYAPYIEQTAYSFEYTVPTREVFEKRFLEITAQFPWLVYEENDQVLGYAYGSAPFERAAFSWCAEVSVYLAPQAQGRGVGKRLYQALEEILKEQGYRLIYSLVVSSNTRSLAFHKKLGYRFLAEFPGCGQKFGQLHSLTWLEKQVDFGPVLSDFPRNWREVVDSDEKLNEFLDKITLS